MSASRRNLIARANIGDLLHLVDMLPDNALGRTYYDDRISPMSYFGDTFQFPMTLLSVMFDTGCVLSGSRALEYFVPGSTGPESDWDFYVPGYKESVADMASVLNRCGVTWHSEAERIKVALHDHGEVQVSGRVLECLSSWLMHLTAEAAVGLVGKEVYNIIEAYKLAGSRREGIEYSVTLDGEKTELDIANLRVSAESMESYEDPSGGSFDILHGQIDTSRGPQKVQLIIGRCYGGIRSCVSFIASFYASHVQCFLGGWCAGHLYYRQAALKKAILWKQSPGGRQDKLERALRKYRQRGYEFTRPTVAATPSIRNLRDGDAILVDYGHLFESHIDQNKRSLLSFWLEERRADANALNWVDLEGSVAVFRSQDFAESRYHRTFAAGTKLPWCYMGRLADLIARGPEQEDCSKDRGFRSSVSQSLKGEYLEMRSAAQSGTVYGGLQDATQWSWVM